MQYETPQIVAVVLVPQDILYQQAAGYLRMNIHLHQTQGRAERFVPHHQPPQ